MVIRSYFNKNNTIIKGSLLNTGLNPNAELFYGSPNDTTISYSRFLFRPDLDRLQGFYDDKTIGNLNDVKHVLKIKNTGCFDNILHHPKAYSFDLILFKINQEWDEGNGYDFIDTCVVGEENISSSPSNWFYPRTNESWSGGTGVVSGSTAGIVIASQHFDAGNEDVEMDITDEINAILSGTGYTNYGYVLAFREDFETGTTNERKYMGLFTRHTQTIYEPHIETTYTNPIRDDRENFFLDKNNKLYLYVNVNGEPSNLDELPIVVIKDSDDLIYSSDTQTTVTHVTKGVYSTDIFIASSDDASDCDAFTDVWSNIKINGVERDEIVLDFVLVDSNKYYNIGTNNTLPREYDISLNGLNNEEKIVRGDIRKVIVEALIPYTVNQKDLLDSLEYRIYTKEGPNEVTIINYNEVNRSFRYNYFLLDTYTLVPGTYYLDIKSINNQTIKTHKGIIKFHIVGLSELNK